MTSIFIFSYQLTWQLVLFPAWFSWPPHCLSSLYQGVSVYHGAQHCDETTKNVWSLGRVDYFQVVLCQCFRLSRQYSDCHKKWSDTFCSSLIVNIFFQFYKGFLSYVKSFLLCSYTRNPFSTDWTKITHIFTEWALLSWGKKKLCQQILRKND